MPASRPNVPPIVPPAATPVVVPSGAFGCLGVFFVREILGPDILRHQNRNIRGPEPVSGQRVDSILRLLARMIDAKCCSIFSSHEISFNLSSWCF